MIAPLTPEQLQAIRERAEKMFVERRSAYGVVLECDSRVCGESQRDIVALLADRELLTARIEELERENAELKRDELNRMRREHSFLDTPDDIGSFDCI